jgi:predicted nucleic acid-binding protein
MPASAFLDTNILIYALTDSGSKTHVAESLLVSGGAIGVQTLNELINVGQRKLQKPWPEIANWLRIIEKLCPPPVPVTQAVHYAGVKIARAHGYGIYDALLLAAALESSCTIFYSEDMHDGQAIGGLKIRNPF